MYKTLLLLLTVFIIIPAAMSYSQINKEGIIRGYVTDSLSGEPLVFANVYIEEVQKGATTNDKGYFVIAGIPANVNLTIAITYVGYEPKVRTFFVEADKLRQIDFPLAPSSYELETIEKIGERYQEKTETEISILRMPIREIVMQPKGVEADIFRSLASLPGVQMTGDISARYYVRGGASNQNMVLLNGVAVYNPFHALGLFSVIDPEVIKSVEFYKGGFPAEYGGRLSSILELVTKEGNRENLSASGSMSFLSTKFSVEGPIPHGSFIFAGRRNYSTKILDNFFEDDDIPVDFYDFFFKLNYADDNILTNGKFSVHGFYSNDFIDNNDPEIENYEWENRILGISWFQMTNEPLFYEVSFSLSTFEGEVIKNESRAKANRNYVKDLTIKADFSYIFDTKDELGVGMKIMDVVTELYVENTYGAVSDIGSHGANISAYGKYKILRWDDWVIDLGLRTNLTRLSGGGGGEYFFEPRTNISYSFSPLFKIKGSVGLYNQELTTLSDETEVISLFEPWFISPLYIDPARMLQYIVGFKSIITENISLDVEAYYKDIQRQPVLNENKVFSNDKDLVDGSGEAYGLESRLVYKEQTFNFSVAYTLGWAWKEANGLKYHPRYDSRHSVSILSDWSFAEGWHVSATWNYSAGLPFTPFKGYYNKYQPGDLFKPHPQYSPYTILGDRNVRRLPDYHRLDISLGKKFQIDFLKFQIDVSVLNVYDRKNLFYFKRESGERVNMLPILPTATIRVEI